MSATHVAVILRTRTGPAYEEESMKTDYPDVLGEMSMAWCSHPLHKKTILRRAMAA